MDPDQDLLDQIERGQSGGFKGVLAVAAGTSVVAALVAYFTLRLELQSSRELSLDGAVLVGIGVGAILLAVEHRLR